MEKKKEDLRAYRFRPQKDVSIELVAEMTAQVMWQAKMLFTNVMYGQLSDEDKKHFQEVILEEKRIIQGNKKIIT